MTPASSRSSSRSSASRSVISGEGDLNSVDEAMNMFTGRNADLDLLPLCELWLDMTAQLKEEDIPSPAGFFEERDEIVKYGVEPLAFGLCSWSACFRPRKIWHKLHVGMKSFVVVVTSRLQLPFLPIWP
ncbi:hypothetical protein TRAPUB_720 [Trametes pubescens]|uniref:Uncharacterized protein n=1 Tax=Trametes pubescens TaxID=154538 RepID=A0A1M2VL85_TRAPU|nr:hypothetical protein TRAPUB_720 [Trametes pubescens]